MNFTPFNPKRGEKIREYDKLNQQGKTLIFICRGVLSRKSYFCKAWCNPYGGGESKPKYLVNHELVFGNRAGYYIIKTTDYYELVELSQAKNIKPETANN